MPRRSLLLLAAMIAPALSFADEPNPRREVLTGREALGDWTTDAPGVRRKLTVADLPKPFDTPSAKQPAEGRQAARRGLAQGPRGVQGRGVRHRPDQPRRVVMTAPNGDIFLAESGPGRVKVLRDADGDGKPEPDRRSSPRSSASPSASPSTRRAPSRPTSTSPTPTRSSASPTPNGDTKATAAPETIVAELPGFARLTGGGHWTRDVAFSLDGKRMFVSVGSKSNIDDNEAETRRADILVFTPEGKDEKIYASGIRNPVGPGRPARDRRPLDLGQRARRPGRPPRARLRDPRRGGRLLRLALVLHRLASR